MASEVDTWKRSLASSIFRILPNNRGFDENSLGNGFVVAVDGRHAYGLTATHVLQKGLESGPERQRAARLRRLGLQASSHETYTLERSQQFLADFSLAGAPGAYVLTRFETWIGSDVALVRLSPFDGQPDAAAHLHPLTLSTFRNLGTDLILAGYEFRRDSVRKKTEESIIFDTRLSLRGGPRLSDIVQTDHGYALAKGATFRASIRIDHGLSGAPVFHSLPEDPSFLVVCGVASADETVGESQGECSERGSLVSSIANALHLPISENVSFLDWLKQGKIYCAGTDPKRMHIVPDENDPTMRYLRIDNGPTAPRGS